MSYHLFLDDERKVADVTWIKLPQVLWTIVRNYEDFVKVIETRGLPEHISFDHDLGPAHYRESMYNPDKHYNNYYTNGILVGTGYHCAKWLVEYCMDNKLPLPKWTVHSMNPIGRENIESLLTGYEKAYDKESST